MSTLAPDSTPVDANAFEPLFQRIAAQPDLCRAIEALVEGLAHEVKAASNDQNVQRLARRLRAHAPALVDAVSARDAKHEV